MPKNRKFDVKVNVNNGINVSNKLPTTVYIVLYHDQLALNL